MKKVALIGLMTAFLGTFGYTITDIFNQPAQEAFQPTLSVIQDNIDSDNAETSAVVSNDQEIVGQSDPDEILYSVVRVTDGDTIVVEMNGYEEKVRLIGIDTPESVHPDQDRNVPYGEIASDFTKEQLEGKAVDLEFDVQERDKYGRLLAYVYLEGKMFNKTLLEEGHAVVSTYPPNVKYVDQFTELQRQARDANLGIWALEVDAYPSNNPTPSIGTKYVGNLNSHKFHYETCSSVGKMNQENMIGFDSREDAISADYAPCKICNP